MTRKGAAWPRRGATVGFWVAAVSGIVVMVVAWVWFGLSFSEEMTEQCKAVSASTSMAGTGILFGLVPLVVVHLAGAAVLGPLGSVARADRRSGWVYAVCAVAVASLIGMIAAQLLFEGRLFSMGVAAADCASLALL